MKLYCEFIGGAKNGHMIPLEIAETMTSQRSDDLSDLRAIGRLVRRAELDCKPVFDGYLGPMWDGLRYEREDGSLVSELDASPAERASGEPVAVLRYETQSVYDAMSN